MGQIESKLFEEAPPWDMDHILNNTDLDRMSINLCWRNWSTDPITKKGKIKFDNFIKVLNVQDESEMSDARKLYKLIDKDEDNKIDFPEMMLFLFTIDENPSREQKLRRSYIFYDQNCSGKITKEEMVTTLHEMDKIKSTVDEKGRLIIPDDVENLFSVMDFAHDNKISQIEFIRATSHYRRLGQLLMIDLLEERRKEIVRKIKLAETNMSKSMKLSLNKVRGKKAMSLDQVDGKQVDNLEPLKLVKNDEKDENVEKDEIVGSETDAKIESEPNKNVELEKIVIQIEDTKITESPIKDASKVEEIEK